MLKAAYVTLVTQTPLRTAKNVKEVLNAFESIDRFTPTHWGPDERARNPYDKEEMLRWIKELDEDYSAPGLHRRKAPRYKAYFWANNDDLTYLVAEFGSDLKDEDVKQVFGLGDLLAERLKPEFGTVHLVWKGGGTDFYNNSHIISDEKLQACGPRPPCARTWFGKHLVKLIGPDLLQSAGVPTRKTAWGGLQMDLVETPWKSDLETLSAKQAEVLEHLEPSGVFGDYESWHGCKPGPSWKPIPEK